jgi:hypothetical protein
LGRNRRHHVSQTDIRYREALLPHIADLRRPGGRIDLNLAEEILAPLGLRDLNRAERVAAGMR